MRESKLITEFEAEAIKILGDRGISAPVLVEWNRRMVARAGDMGWAPTYNGSIYRIRLSWKLFMAYGVDRIHRTFLHELAHVIIHATFGASGHGENFKSMCAQLGGSMCTKYAGHKYAECATSEYLKSPKKLVYTCTCGAVTLRCRRFTIKQIANRICAKCGNSLRNFQISAYTPSIENIVRQES